MDTIDTIPTEKVAQQIAEQLAHLLPDSYKAVNNLIALAIDPKAAKRNLRALHDALEAITAAQQKLDADRIAFDQYRTKETAAIEPQRKAAGQMWGHAQARERAVEEREQAVYAREEELGLHVTAHHDFTPIAGTSITRDPERRTVRRGPGDSSDFPADETLTRAANSQPQRVESAIERFKRLVREDAPPAMPAWDPALAGNSQSQSVERAVDRFRRAREIDQSQMPPWRDPRGAG